MIEIKIINKNPDAIMTIVRELRTIGLVQGVDFDFSFNQSRWDGWDDMIGEIPKTTIFTFYVEKWASFFALKYSS
jgi:hypothetical protein